MDLLKKLRVRDKKIEGTHMLVGVSAGIAGGLPHALMSQTLHGILILPGHAAVCIF